MKYILILTLIRFYNGGNSSIEHIEFKSREACFAARDEWLRQTASKDIYLRRSAFCVGEE